MLQWTGKIIQAKYKRFIELYYISQQIPNKYKTNNLIILFLLGLGILLTLIMRIYNINLSFLEIVISNLVKSSQLSIILFIFLTIIIVFYVIHIELLIISRAWNMVVNINRIRSLSKSKEYKGILGFYYTQNILLTVLSLFVLYRMSNIFIYGQIEKIYSLILIFGIIISYYLNKKIKNEWYENKFNTKNINYKLISAIIFIIFTYIFVVPFIISDIISKLNSQIFKFNFIEYGMFMNNPNIQSKFKNVNLMESNIESKADSIDETINGTSQEEYGGAKSESQSRSSNRDQITHTLTSTDATKNYEAHSKAYARAGDKVEPTNNRYPWLDWRTFLTELSDNNITNLPSSDKNITVNLNNNLTVNVNNSEKTNLTVNVNDSVSLNSSINFTDLENRKLTVNLDNDLNFEDKKNNFENSNVNIKLKVNEFTDKICDDLSYCSDRPSTSMSKKISNYENIFFDSKLFVKAIVIPEDFNNFKLYNDYLFKCRDGTIISNESIKSHLNKNKSPLYSLNENYWSLFFMKLDNNKSSELSNMIREYLVNNKYSVLNIHAIEILDSILIQNNLIRGNLYHVEDIKKYNFFNNMLEELIINSSKFVYKNLSLLTISNLKEFPKFNKTYATLNSASDKFKIGYIPLEIKVLYDFNIIKKISTILWNNNINYTFTMSLEEFKLLKNNEFIKYILSTQNNEISPIFKELGIEWTHIKYFADNITIYHNQNLNTCPFLSDKDYNKYLDEYLNDTIDVQNKVSSKSIIRKVKSTFSLSSKYHSHQVIKNNTIDKELDNTIRHPNMKMWKTIYDNAVEREKMQTELEEAHKNKIIKIRSENRDQ